MKRFSYVRAFVYVQCFFSLSYVLYVIQTKVASVNEYAFEGDEKKMANDES